MPIELVEARAEDAGVVAALLDVRHNGVFVGFVLARGPTSLGRPGPQIAEFCIAPENRRLGVGREAVASLWRRFPGAWEFQVHARNSTALGLSSCIEAAAPESPVVTQVQAADGARVQFTFHVEPTGGQRGCARRSPATFPRALNRRRRAPLAKQE